jgi:hypothetical protein
MTSLADQFAADAGPAPAPVSLSSQFVADAQAAAPAPKAQPAKASTENSLGRQLGLTARAGVTGITALPSMIGDAANTGINLVSHGVNSVLGTHIPDLQMPSQAIQAGENAIGLPQPANATERIVQDATSGMASVPTSLGLGKALSSAASPMAQAVGRGLQIAPGMQVMGAAGAGAGSSGARELGLSTPWQYLGAILGGAAGVGAGSAATASVRALSNALAPAEKLSPAAASARADAGVDQAIKELGPQAQQTFQPVQPVPQPQPVQASAIMGPPAPPAPGPVRGSPNTFQPIKQQVAQIIEQEPNISPAAAVRANDFRNLGIQPTLGQITRDPMQFAQELNMRGVNGVGGPLANRFNQQNNQLQQALYGLSGNAADAYQAGTAIKQSLQSIDSQMQGQVRDAYAAARASSGKNLDVPLTGVAQDYAQVLNDFGDKVPSGVRNNFNQLGLMGGTQQKTFSIENAENLLKVINANQSADPATNTALGQLRNSVKNAILSADDKGGVYAPARALAAQRFALQEQIPALEASAANTINPDDFVRKFIVGGKTDQVNAMAGLLKEHAPDAFMEARNQLGAQLALKGFGSNVAGDAPFKPAGFAQQMQAFGPSKLAAFYSPDEVNQLNAIGRVGSYMNAFPSSAPVNTSNTASALASVLGSGVKKIPYIGGLIDNAQNRMFVSKALAAELKNARTPSAQIDPAMLADVLSKFTPPAKR